MTDTELMGSGIDFTMQKIPRMMVGVIGVLRQKIEVFAIIGWTAKTRQDKLRFPLPLPQPGRFRYLTQRARRMQSVTGLGKRILRSLSAVKPQSGGI